PCGSHAPSSASRRWAITSHEGIYYAWSCLLPAQTAVQDHDRKETHTMRHQLLVRSFVLVVAIVVAGSQAAAEGQGRDRGSQERDGGSEGQDRGSRQGAAAGLVVPIVGTTSAGGTFSGTLTVQRFIARGGNIFAVGLV